MRYAFNELKLVVEPGGAIGLAALLAGKLDVKGKVVVGMLSGGNVDADLFARLIAEQTAGRSGKQRETLLFAQRHDRRQRAR